MISSLYELFERLLTAAFVHVAAQATFDALLLDALAQAEPLGSPLRRIARRFRRA